MKFWSKTKFLVVSSWITLLFLPLIFFAWILAAGASVNLAANGATAMAPILYTCFFAFLISLCFSIAISLTPTKNRRATVYFLQLIFIGIFILSLVGVRIVYNPPDKYLNFLEDTPYATPRKYNFAGASLPGQQNALHASYCYRSKRPRYSRIPCFDTQGIPQYMDTLLSKQSIEYVSSGYLGFHFKDIIESSDGKVANVLYGGSTKAIEVGGLDGVSTRENQKYILWNKKNEIQFVANCRSKAYCRLVAPTPFGTLMYASPNNGKVNVDRWQHDKAWHEALFASWRCEEPTCGGQFPSD